MRRPTVAEVKSGHAPGARVRAVPRGRRGTEGPGVAFEPRKGSPMGSSAFEIVLIPVLRGMVYGIAMGMAMLALMRAIDLLVESTRTGRIWNRAGRSCPVRSPGVMEPGEAAHRYSACERRERLENDRGATAVPRHRRF